jgi:hypothetical protein
MGSISAHLDRDTSSSQFSFHINEHLFLFYTRFISFEQLFFLIGVPCVLFPYSSSLVVGARDVKKNDAPFGPSSFAFGSKQGFSLVGYGSLVLRLLYAFF